jgi:SAM-dependent methyltransferase
VRRCLDCGSLYFVRPLPPHDYNTYYPYLESFDADDYRWELAIRRRQIEAKLAKLGRFGKQGRLIDFGAGPGYFVKGAQSAGWQAQAVEVSAPAVEVGHRQFGLEYLTLEAAEDEAYEAVTCFHVLEHLDDPRSLMSSFRRKLKPGGVLMVHVPNRESLSGYLHWRARTALGRDLPRLGSMYYPDHITGFTPKGLEACGAGAGFTPLAMETISLGHPEYDPMFLGRRWRHANPNALSRALQVARRVAHGAVDGLGGLWGRGDWVTACFRAT